MHGRIAIGRLRAVIAAVALLSAGHLAWAADAPPYPTRPIRFVIPFPPGGGNDILARLIGPKMAEGLGQPVVLENRPGAGGNVGTEQAAKSAPDGYTIVIASNQVTINPALNDKLPFDIERDFAPVALVASVPMLLVINPSLPDKDLREFIADAKANPRKYNYGTPGSGTPQHLAFEVLNKMAGIEVTHVPYKGTGPAIADLLGGQIQSAFATLASIEPHVRAGKVRALAVATPKRSPLLPNVPTVAEAGVPGYDVALWYSVLAPAKTPKPVVNRLAEEIRNAVSSTEIREKLLQQGFERNYLGPAELEALIRTDIARWKKIVRDTGIKVE
jgi:tripartite-type tricarboxylate transporter receptor subunit TctC